MHNTQQTTSIALHWEILLTHILKYMMHKFITKAKYTQQTTRIALQLEILHTNIIHNTQHTTRIALHWEISHTHIDEHDAQH